MLAVASAEVPVFFFVSGRAEGMGTHAKDLLGRTDENGQKRTETVNSAGVRGEWLSVDFRFPPLIPVPFRSPRQSRRDGRTR